METTQNLPHNSDDARAEYQKHQAAQRAELDARRSVPEHRPTLTLEDRVAALEKTVNAMSTPAQPAPEA